MTSLSRSLQTILRINLDGTLKKAIDEYMDFYNTRRLQAKLKGLAPLAYRNQTLVA